MNTNHRLLLKKQLRQATPETPRKRRKKHQDLSPEPIGTKHEALESSSDSDDLEDVDLSAAENSNTDARESSETPAAGDNDASDEFEDLEDVDLEEIFTTLHVPLPATDGNETLTFSLEQEEETPKGKGRRKFVPVSKEERARRRLIHKLCLEAMLAHGVVRNKWCNDKEVQANMRQTVPAGIRELLKSANDDVLDYVKARRFVESIKKLLLFYQKKFRTTSQGIVRKNWDDLLKPQELTDGKVSLVRFRRLTKNFRGSRDVGAQGFVALLRSLGITARLVFSIQTPDYRSIVPVGDKETDEKPKQGTPKPASEFDPVFIPSLKQEFLSDARKSTPEFSRKGRKFPFPKLKFPIFWIEVWNKYSRKWLSVDPLVLNLVDVLPKRRKSKFEPPASDATCQMWYVIAYDANGNVKDVTRRYNQYYNAKTVKKRIEFNSDEDEHWYMRLIRSARPENLKPSEADIVETKEFYDRDVCEGIPGNMADFKNHPVYALELQLRQDEVIYPKDDTSKCGLFRPHNKNTVLQVYKRSHVFRLRTAKAWYMRGRVLKIGVQPLRTKEASKFSLDDEDEGDGLERLYAEFQTEMYKAPPIVDGTITKNAYGNLEIYTPTMMPDNGYLARVSQIVTMKMLERAARVLQVDYAKAIVAFDFGAQKSKRTPTAREGGIVVDKQFKEAILAVLEQLEEMEEEEKRMQVELNALRSWKFFLTKLKIMKRLDKQHGKLEDEKEKARDENDIEEDEEEGYFSVASDDDSVNSGEEDYMPKKRRRFLEEEDEFEEGGFMLDGNGPIMENGPDQEEIGEEDANEGGILSEGGGFMKEETAEANEPGEDFGEDFGDGGFFPEGGEFLPEEGGFVTEGGIISGNDFAPVKAENLTEDGLSTGDLANVAESESKAILGSDTENDAKPQSDKPSVDLDLLHRAILPKIAKSGKSDHTHTKTVKDELGDSEGSPEIVLSVSNSEKTTEFPKKSNQFAQSLQGPADAGSGRFAMANPFPHSTIASPEAELSAEFIVIESDSGSDHGKREKTRNDSLSSVESVVSISDDSEISRIEKEEEELGLEYSDSE